MKPFWEAVVMIGVVLAVLGIMAVVVRLATAKGRAADRFAARCDTLCLPYAARVTSGACYCARPDGTWAPKEPTP